VADRPGIVVGLGNPGTRYVATRHNLGFRVLDRLAQRCGAQFRADAQRAAQVARIDSGERGCVLAKPRTFMNRSGRAVLALLGGSGSDAARLLVVYDDADLELGCIRIRLAGGAGGHNGLRSIIDALRTTEFPRLRLGIRGARRDEEALEDYVLEPFDDDERARADELVELGADAVEAILADGLARAMNRFNGRTVDGTGRGG